MTYCIRRDPSRRYFGGFVKYAASPPPVEVRTWRHVCPAFAATARRMSIPRLAAGAAGVTRASPGVGPFFYRNVLRASSGKRFGVC